MDHQHAKLSRRERHMNDADKAFDQALAQFINAGGTYERAIGIVQSHIAELQIETQRDYDEERDFGWSV